MSGFCCESDIRHPEKIARARQAMPSELELLDASELLKIFADSNRMRLIAALLEVELCVCDLSEFLGMSQSAVSHQLRILRQSRLVRCRRDGKNAYYSLKDSHVEQIVKTALEHVREMYMPNAEE